MELQEEDRIAQEKQRAEGTLNAEVLATVGHELRSPLTAIIGYTATLLRQERRISREERREFLLAIRDASERLQAIVDRFLEVSALETGNIKLRRAPVDAARIAGEALLNAELRASEHLPNTFSFHLLLKDERGQLIQQVPLVWADRRLLREVLDNLLENAIIYSPDGGRIDIVIRPVQLRGGAAGRPATGENKPEGENEGKAVSVTPRMIDIVVCDNGQGIPSDHLERIFERFHRVETGLTRTANGLGLGLTVSRRIIEMHGGTIWAESCPAGGSAFHVLLPLYDENKADEDAIS
ncbi:MAG TPA: ATP-binding protein [Ktedonobacteraceae bacterium]|nr:ATP-binding protein [Ktedonobacteraceae bacterium]